MTEMSIDGRYSGESITDQHFSKKFNISKRSYILVDKKESKELADHTSFTYFGGWFANKGQPFESRGFGCKEISYARFPVDFIRQVFYPIK